MSCSSMAPNMPSLLPPIVLSFAGTDPTGGAGIQADLLTLSSMGCHALTVVTAITGVILIDAIFAIFFNEIGI